MDNPSITGTVVGITKPTRVDALLAALAVDLPEALTSRLDALLPDPQYWLT